MKTSPLSLCTLTAMLLLGLATAAVAQDAATKSNPKFQREPNVPSNF